MNNNCPFSERFCTEESCRECKIRIEALEKAREDKQIADNMRSYWANLNAGSAR